MSQAILPLNIFKNIGKNELARQTNSIKRHHILGSKIKYNYFEELQTN